MYVFSMSGVRFLPEASLNTGRSLFISRTQSALNFSRALTGHHLVSGPSSNNSTFMPPRPSLCSLGLSSLTINHLALEPAMAPLISLNLFQQKVSSSMKPAAVGASISETRKEPLHRKQISIQYNLISCCGQVFLFLFRSSQKPINILGVTAILFFLPGSVLDMPFINAFGIAMSGSQSTSACK